jgi:hypothetical protein
MDRDDAPAAAEAARGMEGRCAGASAVARRGWREVSWRCSHGGVGNAGNRGRMPGGAAGGAAMECPGVGDGA